MVKIKKKPSQIEEETEISEMSKGINNEKKMCEDWKKTFHDH